MYCYNSATILRYLLNVIRSVALFVRSSRGRLNRLLNIGLGNTAQFTDYQLVIDGYRWTNKGSRCRTFASRLQNQKNRRRRGCFDPTAEPSERGQPIQAFTGTDSRSRLDRCRDSAG